MRLRPVLRLIAVPALLFVAGLAGFPLPAASWNSDPAANTPVCTLPGIQVNPDAVSNGAAGTIVVWEDARGANRDIYAQRFDAYGAPSWASNGILVCGASADQILPRVVSDGAGGAVVVWNDRRGSGTSLDVYAQRLGPDGSRLWASEGVPVCTALYDQNEFDIVADGAGGAYVIWVDFRADPLQNPSNSRSYVQHILPTGLPAWTVSGLRVGLIDKVTDPRIALSASGGIFAIMNRPDVTEKELSAFRVAADGSMPWSTSGLNPAGVTRDGRGATIVPDGTGGMIVAWIQALTRDQDEIRVQRMSVAGVKLWSIEGIVARSSSSPVAGLAALPDGHGGVTLAWQDERNDAGDIFAQRVDSLGAPAWGLNGTALGVGPITQSQPLLAPDGQDGWFVSFEGTATGGSDLFVQRVTSSGLVVGPAGGAAISTAPGSQDSHVIAADGTLGAVAFWSDTRTPAIARDLYAARVSPLPLVGDPPRITSVVPPQAAQGAPVTVFGSGFSGVSEVRFGSTTASFTFVSDGEIQTTASSCGVARVQSTAGLSAGGPVLESSPQVTSLSPSAATVQTSIRITGSCFDGATSVHFNGSLSTNFVVQSPQEIFAIVPGGSTSGPVTVTSAVGVGTSAGYFTVLPQLGELAGCYFVPPFPGYSTGTNPADIVLADVNLDQRPDLIVSNSGAGTISVRAGAGDGSFGAPTDYAAGATPGSMAIADFNADGRPDILVENGAAASVSLLRGLPGGLFSTPQSFAVGGAVVKVKVGDFDLDGNFDAALLLAINVNPDVRVLPGDGSGGFLAPLSLHDVDGVDLEVGDVTGDGKPEIVVLKVGKEIQSLVNQGGFVFTKLAQTGFDGPYLGRALALADISGDGRLDAIVVASNPPAVLTARGQPDGRFDPMPAIETLSVSSDLRDVILVDVNLDGLDDIAVADQGTSQLRILLARGDTSFETALAFVSPMFTPSRLSIGDLDRDGRRDLVAMSPSLGMTSALLNFGANDLFCPPSRSYAAQAGPRDLVAIDFNNDGLIDLAAADSTGRRIDLWPGIGDGTFGALTVLGPTETGVSAIAAADFDGDTHLDLALSGGSQKLEVYLANGAGGFLGRVTTGANADDGLAVGRINADAFLDAVIAKRGSAGLSLMLGNAQGGFSFNSVAGATGSDPRRPALGDLDGDGELDLVVADYEAGGVRVFLGNGAGTFAAPVLTSTASRANFVVLTDVDGDLKLDAVVTHATVATLSLLPGLGTGAFGPRRDFPALGGARSVRLGDVNGDGWLDAIVTHPTSGKVSLFLNARDGGFTPRKDFAYFGSPLAAVIRDFNGDFKNDLAVVEINHNRLTVVLNRGDFQAGTWLGGGIALGPGSGQRFFPVQTPDGAGGSLVGWRELRGSGEFDPYVQRLTSSGTLAPDWPVNGRAITNASGNQYVHGIVSDDHFGALVAWADSRDSVVTPGRGLDIYVQRADSASTLRWAPNGVPLCTASGDQTDPLLVGDGQGGALAVWADLRNGIPDYYAQHVDASGTPLWTTNGIPVSNIPGIRIQATMVSDGIGGAYVVWTEGTGSSQNIVGQHLDSGGAPLWGPGGVVVCGAPGAQSEPEVIVDEFWNLVVAWTDQRGGNADLYWQRLDGAGVAAWQPDGLLGVPNLGEQRQATMVSDGLRGGIIGWTDDRSGNEDVYATRFDENGQIAPGWPAGGVAVASAANDQFAPQAITDGAGGAIFFWRDERNGNLDLYAQRIASYGLPAPGWTTDGVAVCEVVGAQTLQSAVSDGQNGGIAVWQDSRSDSTTIFAARIDGLGDAQPVGVFEPRPASGAVRFAGPWPNPASGSARFAVDLPVSTPVRLEIFDVAGRRVRTVAPAEPFAAGRHALVWDGRNESGARAASGVFFARLRAGTAVLTRRCVLLR